MSSKKPDTPKIGSLLGSALEELRRELGAGDSAKKPSASGEPIKAPPVNPSADQAIIPSGQSAILTPGDPDAALTRGAAESLAGTESAMISESHELSTQAPTVFKDAPAPTKIADRFRGYLPVVVDVETAGFDAATDALLEIACQPILMDEHGKLYPGEPVHAHLTPFEGAVINKASLEFTGIDLESALRAEIAEDEKTALKRLFKELNLTRRAQQCKKCILIGHNAHFDLNFLNAAIARTSTKNQNPFHAFSVLDTVTLSALAFGQTVLARTCKRAGIEFSGEEAHSALYDTQKTAELFCHVLNHSPLLPVADTAEPKT